MMAKRPDSPRIFVPPPLIFATGLLAGLALDGRLAGGLPPGGLGIKLGAALLVLAGLVLIAAGLGIFWRKETRAEPWAPASALVTTGIYRRTRNPMYLGMAAVSAGVALLFQSPTAGAFLLGVIVIMDRIVIPREEAYLTRRFGPDYEAFRARVRRWF